MEHNSRNRSRYHRIASHLQSSGGHLFDGAQVIADPLYTLKVRVRSTARAEAAYVTFDYCGKLRATAFGWSLSGLELNVDAAHGHCRSR